ncbi:MAG: C39 family peptidase [Candidatus Omnitrophica bacterium]|nr:C39 family peptidase [Candidatus Omnitrophota bacterium]
MRKFGFTQVFFLAFVLILQTGDPWCAGVIIKGRYFKINDSQRLELDSENTPKKYYIDDVPNLTQDTQWCGPTSLSIVLEYWRERSSKASYSKKDIKPLVLGRTIDKEEDGVSASDIVEKAKSFGLFANVYKATGIDTIKPILASDFPVIMLNRSVDQQQGHARVVVGYSDQKETLKIHDPAHGVYTRPYKRVMEDWEPYGNLFVIIGPQN